MPDEAKTMTGSATHGQSFSKRNIPPGQRSAQGDEQFTTEGERTVGETVLPALRAHKQEKRQRERTQEAHESTRRQGDSEQGATTQAEFFTSSVVFQSRRRHTHGGDRRERRKTTRSERCAPARQRQRATTARGRTHSGSAPGPGACVVEASRAARSLLTAATAWISSAWRLMARDGPALKACTCFGRLGRGRAGADGRRRGRRSGGRSVEAHAAEETVCVWSRGTTEGVPRAPTASMWRGHLPVRRLFEAALAWALGVACECKGTDGARLAPTASMLRGHLPASRL